MCGSICESFPSQIALASLRVCFQMVEQSCRKVWTPKPFRVETILAPSMFFPPHHLDVERDGSSAP